MKKFISSTKSKLKREREETTGPQMQIGSPTDLILQIPRPQLDANGVPIQAVDHEIDRDTMQAALRSMGSYLVSKGQNLTVIAVGGVVNLLLLRSRQSTHDLDFFGTHLDNHERASLGEAARFAETQSGKPLGIEWFNNQTQMWLSPPRHRQLTEQSLQQNEVVFQSSGLKIVAAPWTYALASKTHRIAQDRRGEQNAKARPYDATDAAAYLRKYIRGHGDRPQRFEAVQAWCREYGFQVDVRDLAAVASEYRRMYNEDGLVT